MNWRFWQRNKEVPAKPVDPAVTPLVEFLQAEKAEPKPEPVKVLKPAPKPEPTEDDSDRMNPDVKARWLEALRSGDYKQGKHKLRRREEHQRSEYCCLGVLCEIAVKDGVISPPEREDGIYLYDGMHSLPSLKVTDWAGLDDSNPIVRVPGQDRWSSLAEMNDDGSSFAEIADVIEKQL